MAGEIYRDVDLDIPLTKVLTFPQSVSVSVATWNKFDLGVAATSWYATAIKLANEQPLINNEWLVGIEVEAENVSHTTVSERLGEAVYPIWTAKPDNSLRNNGMEYVSIPIKGTLVHKAMSLLQYALGSKVDFSSRCSVHVHLNVRDMTVGQVVALGLIYAAVERLLFRWAGQDREHNIFCVPVYMTHDLQGLFAAAMAKFHKPVSFKYSALNFNTTCLNSGLPLYGTVEFRHLPGTASAEMLVKWINLIFSIKKFAMKHPLDAVLKMIVDLNTTSAYGLFLKNVFGPLCDSVISGVKSVDEFQAMMEASITEVKRCAFNNVFHQHLHHGYPAASSPFTKALRKKYGPFRVTSSKKPSDGPFAGSEGVPVNPSVAANTLNDMVFSQPLSPDGWDTFNEVEVEEEEQN